MKRFIDKIVVITGAGSGIGLATAALFEEEGADVFRLDLKDRADRSDNSGAGKESGSERKQGPGRFIRTDVLDSDSIREAVNRVIDEYGRIDILCNNAGVELSGTIEDTSEEEWDRVMGVNVKGIYLVSKQIISYMKRNKSGAIVNTSSISGLLGWPASAVYCSSKGAVIQLTRQMAVDYAKFNIRINCICPGTTQTPMIDRLFSLEANPDEARRNIAAKHPLERFADPSEIGQAILFLASEDASFITGVDLPVDGGYTTK